MIQTSKEQEGGVVAYVLGDSKVEPWNKKIYITDYYIETMGLTSNIAVLLYETSHFHGVPRSGKWAELYEAKGTQDYFYRNVTSTNDVDAVVREMISDFNRWYSNMDEALQFGVQKRDPGLSRLKTALHNADNIAATALSLGREKLRPAKTFDFHSRHPIIQEYLTKKNALIEMRASKQRVINNE